MPLIKPTLEADILNALNSVSQVNIDPVQARINQANLLATAIDNYIKSGLVSVTVAVTTAGSATNQAGTGTGTGAIS